MNLRDIASKVKGYIQSKTQDDEGWIRQGKFTPVQELKSQFNPVNLVTNAISPAYRNFSLPEKTDFLKSAGSGLVNTSTFGLVQPKYQPQTQLGKYGMTAGKVAGFVNPIGPGAMAMRGIEKAGAAGIARFAPQLTKTIGGKIVGGIGKEALQTAGYTLGKIGSMKAGLSPDMPITAASIGQDLLLGSVLRGATAPRGLSAKVKGITGEVWTRDKNMVNEFRQRFATKISPGEYAQAQKAIKIFEQPYSLTSNPAYKKMNLSQKFDYLNDVMNQVAKDLDNVKMGIVGKNQSTQPIKTGGDIIQSKSPAGFDNLTDNTFKTKGGELVITENTPNGNSVQKLYVDESARRQGIATRLLEEAKNKYNTISAQVSNEASVKLHYKSGFRPYDNPNATLNDSLDLFNNGKSSSINMVWNKPAGIDAKPNFLSQPIKTEKVSNLSPESKGIKVKPNDDLVAKFDETIKVSPNENKLSLNNQENQGILSADQKIRVKSEPKLKVQPYQTSTSQPIISNEPFIDKNGELQFPGIDDEFKAFIGEGRPKVKGPFETPDLDTSKTGIAKGTILGGGAEKASPEVKQSFATWVNARRASQVEGIIKSREFKDLDSKGIDGIFEFQAGDKSGKFKALKDYFDTKFNQANTEGIKVNYKEDYLPQMWNNSTEQVNQVFGNRLGLKPSFTIESLIKDYKTGIEQGLTPKFTKISDLVASYETRVNKSIADRKFFDGLKTDNIILPANKAPLDWVTLDPDRFPKLSLSTDQGQYTGIYKAPEDIGKMINNYLSDPSTSPNVFLKGMNSIANWTSNVKNRVLSFGIPGTAINAHGFNILSRNIMSSRNPIEGAITGIKYMLNPNSAMRDLDVNLKDAPDAIKNGLTLSANEFKSVLDEPQGIRGKVGDVWNKLFEKGLFDKMLPALKLQKYKEVKNGFIKGGMNESEAGRNAAKFINTTFGGMNWEELGKSRDWQNFKRITILAPDWLGTNIKLAGKIPQSFLKLGDKTLAPYRRFTATFLGTYLTMNVVNKLSSGHWMYQNDPGNTFNIEAGYTEDGKKRYIRPFGTAADFARLPVDVISGLVKGDISVIPRLIRNRLSIPAGVGLGALTDTDYTGQPIGYRGKDKYGNDIPLKQRAMGMGGELATLAGLPAFAKQGLDYLGGKVSGEEALLQGFELPVRYSGGAYTKTQKEIRDSFKVKGASGQELYDINKQIKGQTFGENQKAEIISSGREKITEILQEKEKNKIIDKAREEVKNTGQTTEVQGIILYKDKQLDTETGEYKTVVKSIDLSKPINKPNLTGNKEVDKKMTSSYNSKITSRINDIVKLVELEKLDANTAEKMIAELKKTKLSTGSKKGKKITAKIIKITSPKANIKFSSPRASKFKLKPSPKIKITKTDNRKYTIKA